jgi:enoyl-CoA hydratase/carnithine racemase
MTCLFDLEWDGERFTWWVATAPGCSTASGSCSGASTRATRGRRSSTVDGVQVDDFGSVRVLAFDRPDKLNALNADMADRATAALLAADRDPAIRAVVLTGSGRAFCAGVDLGHLAAIGDGSESSHHTIDFNSAIRFMKTPVVAAVNGLAVGVGCTMCLHVDLVLAGAAARFQTPFAKIGVAPEIGSSRLLPGQIGHQRASWMLLTAGWVDADTAVEWGLAFESVADDRLLDRAIEIADLIAANDPEAVVAAKQTMREWRLPLIDAAEEIENAAFGKLLDRHR